MFFLQPNTVQYKVPKLVKSIYLCYYHLGFCMKILALLKDKLHKRGLVDGHGKRQERSDGTYEFHERLLCFSSRS